MSEFQGEISRKSFLKLVTGAVVGASLAAMPKLTSAGAARPAMQSSSVDALPEAVEAARQSELVRISYEKIKSYVSSIKDNSLRRMTAQIIDNPQPTFMQLYRDAGSKRAVYNKLAELGLIDKAKTPLANFLPPTDRPLQPFFSAPGSGYASHHAYPGGLATHTAANLCISEGIYDTYKAIYNSSLSRDIIISAQALHDLAKPFVFQWQKDQTSLKEYTIAKTGAHHILSIAEVVYRGFPAAEIIAQACAHATPGNPADEALVVGWLKAGAIIAGKDAAALGLITNEDKLAVPQHQEGYIVSLGDHDFVLSGPACQNSVALLKKLAASEYGFSETELSGAKFNAFRNFVFAQSSAMYVDSLAGEKNGRQAVRDLVTSIITK